MEELRSCLFCGYTSNEEISQCPGCQSKRKFLTKKRLLIMGWVQLICGLFLVGMMGTITINVLPSLLPLGHQAGIKIFTGTPEQARLMLILFSILIMTGLACTVSGLWLLITKRIKKWLYWLTIGLFSSVFFAVQYVLIYF
jgi:hypothetical protein